MYPNTVGACPDHREASEHRHHTGTTDCSAGNRPVTKASDGGLEAMSSDSTPTEVFPDVDPDPDEILDQYDADSVAALLEMGGRHDPTTDDAIDADDTTAAELFDHLEAVSTDPVSVTCGGTDDDGATSDGSSRDGTVSDGTDDGGHEAIDVDWTFVGDPERTVRRNGTVDAAAEAVARTRGTDPSAREAPPAPSQAGVDEPDSDGFERRPVGEERSRTLSLRSAVDLELVGSAPTPRRISDDAFGRTRFVFGRARDDR